MTRPDYTSLEQRLTAALHQEASLAMTTTDTPRELQRWRDQQNKRRNKFRIGVVAATAAAVAGIILGITFGIAGSDSSRRDPAHNPPAPVPSTPATVTLSTLGQVPAGTTVSKTDGPVNPGSVAFGAVWATGLEKTEKQIYRLDPDTGDILSTATFTPADGVAPVPTRVGDRIVVASSRGYDVFDRSGEKVDTIRTELPGAVAGDASGGWVQLNGNTLARLDASGSATGQRVHVGKPNSGAFVVGIASVDDALYAVTSAPRALWHFDAKTGDVVDTLDLTALPVSVLATHSAVYVATETYELYRVGLDLSGVTAVSKNDIQLGSFFLPFLGPDESLWITPNQGGIVELDPATLKVIRSFELRENQDPGWNFGGAVTKHRAFVGSVRIGAVLSIPID